MANSSHVRSVSFPSRSQPEYLKVDIELNRLKTWESSSISSATTPLSLSTIQQGLVGLAELYNSVQDLLESPTIQQALVKHQMRGLAEETLDASVGLIVSCNTVRELVLMMKEHVQDLQSALRRKVGDSSIHIENKIESCTQVDLDQSLSKLLTVLRQVSALTISVQRYQLYFLSSRASKAKKNRWSLISKMLLTKSVACKGDEKIINEVECVDFALFDLSMIQRKLQTKHTALQAIEAEIECLSRLLIRNRVCLLNILTPLKILYISSNI
ncbi:unnamed protein product [Withania somnifera]